MTRSQEERQQGTASAASGTPTQLPDDAREVLTRGERLVYLFPDHFDSRLLVLEDALLSDPRISLEYESVDAPRGGPATLRTIVGHMDRDAFALEVRERSITIVAEHFLARLDLMVLLKEFADSTQPLESGDAPAVAAA